MSPDRPTDKDKGLDCGDESKRDQVLKRLLSTPHKPHGKPKQAPKKEKPTGRS